ncbi:hypothetical protein Celal_3698 [Cellulophaga algicola DSM 14237]|uniref:Maf-like protein n=1 Tax=Cellulophaga algicola (strain DSM 14237 / IC166 / ACAM 630) TaxID=688270 RepID=E6X9Z2_CELAD|nr:hypothetical protein [Cellulophaga algicola]ADV50953.1 hypothetical protein Celal_3698 [Cellulophaga algicola DSM 14237]
MHLLKGINSKILMTVVLNLFAIIGFTQTTTTDYTVIDTEITDHYKDYKYSNKKRPGYYLQINNQNCHYEIDVNDLSCGEYYDQYPMYSVKLPLNLNILKSGKQKLSVKVFPSKGDMISEKAEIQLRLIRYADITDIENEFGKSRVIWEWEMPIVGEHKLPIFVFQSTFEANVPFKLEVLDVYATDLSVLDEKVVLDQVLKEFQLKQKKIVDKTQDRDYLIRHLNRAFVQIYPDNELLTKTVDDMLTVEKGMELQPLDDYEIRFYYNYKIATLVRKENKQPAIWFNNPSKKEKSYQPYYIFKHKKTGTWHMW